MLKYVLRLCGCNRIFLQQLFVLYARYHSIALTNFNKYLFSFYSMARQYYGGQLLSSNCLPRQYRVEVWLASRPPSPCGYKLSSNVHFIFYYCNNNEVILFHTAGSIATCTEGECRINTW